MEASFRWALGIRKFFPTRITFRFVVYGYVTSVNSVIFHRVSSTSIQAGSNFVRGFSKGDRTCPGGMDWTSLGTLVS